MSEILRFGYGETGLGTVMVAEGVRGVVALFMGDDRDKLRHELTGAFPDASLVLDQTGMAETTAKAAALVDAPHLGTDLALDLRGSASEMAVWEALKKIPSGETRSYGEIARGLAMTAQDVGAACAANRVAIAVPCHRVVKADGSISGYRWGVRRKRRLINMEGVV